MGGEKKGILVPKQSRALLDFARGTAYDANDWYGLQMFHPAGFNITHSCDKILSKGSHDAQSSTR